MIALVVFTAIVAGILAAATLADTRLGDWAADLIERTNR